MEKLIIRLILAGILFLNPLLTLNPEGDKIPPIKTINPELIRILSETYKKPRWLIRRIVEAAVVHGNPSTFPTPKDILAVAEIESGFDPAAVSSSGAVGVMQLKPKYWKGDLKSPSSNVKVGAKALKEYHQRMGSKNGALIAYNQGPTAAKQICAKDWCSTKYTSKFWIAKTRLEGVSLFIDS